MSTETVLLRREGPAAILTLNRPEKFNALNPKALTRLTELLAELELDGEVRGIIITGHEKFFCTGADLNVSVARPDGNELAYRSRLFRAVSDGIEINAKPVLAAISGWCLTGGLELAMVCDLRIADEGARFGMTSSRIGSVASWGGTQRLPRLVGESKAKELLFSGEYIDAAEAHRINLINRVVPSGQAVAEAQRMIDVYVDRGPFSIQFMKQAVNVGMQMDLRSALELEINLAARNYGHEDRSEGMRAFLEKRKANFKGR